MKVLFIILLGLGSLSFSFPQQEMLSKSEEETVEFIRKVYQEFLFMDIETVTKMMTDDMKALVVVIYNTRPVQLYPVSAKEGIEMWAALKDQIKPGDVEVNVDNIVVHGQYAHSQGSMQLFGKNIFFWEFFEMTGSDDDRKFVKGLSLVYPEDDEEMSALLPSVVNATAGAEAVEEKLEAAIASTNGTLGVLDSAVSEWSMMMGINISTYEPTAAQLLTKLELLASPVSSDAYTLTAGPFAAIVETDETDSGTTIWDTIKFFLTDKKGQIEMAVIVTNEDGSDVDTDDTDDVDDTDDADDDDDKDDDDDDDKDDTDGADDEEEADDEEGLGEGVE
eukprot:GHVS01009713.1.p1 GENE.GHVS01009713.1~~GHVS01009713.1.p1  ORF type:complete len:335 (+),score=76.78 GHVS01009713.1:94-1098(+)